MLGGRPLAPLIGFLGAGIYEEAIFRLALIPLLYGAFRLLQATDLPAGTLAVTGASLLFALAHHAGTPAEPFTWYVFLFRWTAGVYFSALFLMRGFGVAVGAHAAYDVLVGWLDWPST
jgi:membrane protease YdiL (CAAX protease family)